VTKQELIRELQSRLEAVTDELVSLRTVFGDRAWVTFPAGPDRDALLQVEAAADGAFRLLRAVGLYLPEVAVRLARGGE
jgi:hypothetical protein